MDELKKQQLTVMLRGIKPPDEGSRRECQRRWDAIAKPIGGLGKLEEIVAQIAAIERTPDVKLDRKALVIFCADNGVVEEGVSQSDQSVTARVTENLARGITSANVMAACADVDVLPVDIGVAAEISTPGVFDAKLARGTASFLKGPAMSMDETIEAVLSGIQTAGRVKDMGYDIVAAGEMGIGNTTTSAAVAAVMLNLKPEEVTGRGAGLSDEGLLRKKEVIRQGIILHHPDPADPLNVLSCLGGFDIAGICGLMLGGAIYDLPVVMDGVVSAAAALIAGSLAPEVTGYLIPSHEGKEPLCQPAFEALGLCPIIHADLALGEGTGALLLLSLLDMAEAVYKESATFEDTDIEPYEHFISDGSDIQ